MIKCPHCQATLPDGTVRCQFCGTQFAPAAGSRTPAGSAPDYNGSPQWVKPVYYFIASWWILDGLIALLRGTLWAHSGAGVGILGLLFGLLTLLIGAGLVFQVDLVKGIVNILCFLQIVSGALDLLGAFFLSPLTGIWGILAVLIAFVRIGLAGLMIFVIGETETRAPNF